MEIFKGFPYFCEGSVVLIFNSFLVNWRQFCPDPNIGNRKVKDKLKRFL